MFGATVFPHNIGLGATRDPALVKQIGEATAEEVRATGIPWNFGPCVCVTRDERWGRTYESFGEDPALVAQMETIIDGLQGHGRAPIAPDRVLATAKHYAGDGDTEYDDAIAADNEGEPWYEQRYTIDQGITVTSRDDFDDDRPGARTRRRSGGTTSRSVMPSFSSVDWIEDGVGDPLKMHAHQRADHRRAQGRAPASTGSSSPTGRASTRFPTRPTPATVGSPRTRCGSASTPASTCSWSPTQRRQFEQLLLAEVNAGRVSMARIDDAVSRILPGKFELGLFEHPFASTDDLDEVGSPAHRALAREAVGRVAGAAEERRQRAAAVADANIYVAGRNADDIGNQAGGWTIAWQGVSGDIIPGTTILEGIREVAPQATVTYSADASAPMTGRGRRRRRGRRDAVRRGLRRRRRAGVRLLHPAQLEEKSLSLSRDQAVIDTVCVGDRTCVVLVVSGRPQVLTDQLGEMDALVASWLPGSEGAGVADVLFGKRPFTGRLPMTWPRTEAQVPINVGDADYDPLFPYGWGLRTD